MIFRTPRTRLIVAACRARQRGFSVLEVLASTAILALIMGMGIRAFDSVVQLQSQHQTAIQATEDLQRLAVSLRSEAVDRDVEVAPNRLSWLSSKQTVITYEVRGDHLRRQVNDADKNLARDRFLLPRNAQAAFTLTNDGPRLTVQPTRETAPPFVVQLFLERANPQPPTQETEP